MNEPATKADLARATDEIRQDTRLEFQEVRAEIARVDKGLRGEIASVRGEIARVDEGLRGEIARVDEGLRAESASVRGEITRVDEGLRAEIARVDEGLRGEIAQLDKGLRGELQQMEGRLSQEIGAAVSHAVNVALEQNREYMGLLDEKYRHVPGELAALRSGGHRGLHRFGHHPVR